VEEFNKDKGIDLSKDKDAVRRLKEAAEKAKIDLSESLQTEIGLPYISADQNGPLHLSKKLTRSTFEHKTRHLLEKTVVQVDKALQDAKEKKGEEVKIDEIILVGGSTRMAMVSKFIEEK
jgi:molecular chaperone DnaK